MSPPPPISTLTYLLCAYTPLFLSELPPLAAVRPLVYGLLARLVPYPSHRPPMSIAPMFAGHSMSRSIISVVQEPVWPRTQTTHMQSISGDLPRSFSRKAGRHVRFNSLYGLVSRNNFFRFFVFQYCALKIGRAHV